MLFLFSAQTKGEEYCAKFDTGGVSGSFAISVENGLGTYSYYVDLTSFDTPCLLSSGISYHLHSFWTDGEANSGTNGGCGGAFTGGHYDPNLACGGASQGQGAGGLCQAIDRSSPQYTYSCDCSSGDYSTCEVGDFAGKFGKAMETGAGSMIFSKQDMADVVPPYDFNYLTASEPTSNQWASIVFHCADGTSNNGARLVCAKFVPYSSVDDPTCGSAPDLSDTCLGPFPGFSGCESKIQWTIDNRPADWYTNRGLDETRCSVQGFWALPENGLVCPGNVPTGAPTVAPTSDPTESSSDCPGPFPPEFSSCEEKITYALDVRPITWFEKRSIPETRCAVQDYFFWLDESCPPL